MLRTDFKLELGKVQSVQILLNPRNELPTTSSIEEAKSVLGQDLELGNVFYKNGDVHGIFCQFARRSNKSII